MFKKLVNLELSRNQQTVINIVAGVLNMLVTTLISFVLSPYIVATLGVEANGFVGLANNFINYVSLASTALNSMGSRFMMMAYYNDEYDRFQRYYSTLLFANLGLATAFGILGAVCVWKLEYMIVIPYAIVADVKMLFAILFANYVLTTMVTVWSTAPFIKNRLYLNSIANMGSAAVRGLMILGLFLCLKPSVSFLGVATLVSGTVTHLLQWGYKHALFPRLKAKRKDFSWAAIWEMLSSGIWNTVSCLGLILTNGVDLLVTNLFISATAMGTLSVAQTMPIFVNTLNETIANAFAPSLIIDYAQEKLDNLVNTIRQSSKIISLICSLPLGFLLIYGEEFYRLWQPTQDAHLLYILSVIIIFGRVFFTGMQPLFSVFTVVNKVKQHSLVIITNGVISVSLMYLLLQYTQLGIYAVAGTSVICCFVKNICFVIPFSAKYLGLKATAFYPVLLPSVSCTLILMLWGSFMKLFLQPDNWVSLILTGALFASIGLCLISYIILDKKERSYLLGTLKQKFFRSH